MNSKKEVCISIVIPTYKRVDFLEIALESAINQHGDICNYEIIVLDNEVKKDTDTEILMKRYKQSRVRYIKNDVNLGMIGNWNKGFDVANSEWIAMLHDDDCLDSNYIEKIYNYMNLFPDAGCIIPNYRVIDANGNILKQFKKNKRNKKLISKVIKNGAIKKNDMDDKLLGYNHYGPPTCGMIVKKEYSQSINGYNDTYRYIADWDFFLRLRSKCSIYKLNEILGSYRWAVNDSLNIDIHKNFKERILCIESYYKKLEFKNEKIRENVLKSQKEFIVWKYKHIHNRKTNKFAVPKLKFIILFFVVKIYEYFR